MILLQPSMGRFTPMQPKLKENGGEEGTKAKLTGEYGGDLLLRMGGLTWCWWT